MKDWKIVKWAKKHKVLTGIIVVVMILYIVYQNWFYWGTVVDTETGKPIEGAVVVAKWDEDEPSVGGVVERLKDVKETLTDENGKWMIRGPKGGSIAANISSFLPFIYSTQEPEFIVFKPGHCPWPGGYQIDACEGILVDGKHYGNIWKGETLGLPKLTKREDRLEALPGPIHARGNLDEHDVLRKQKVFFTYINKERRDLGLSEYQSY